MSVELVSFTLTTRQVCYLVNTKLIIFMVCTKYPKFEFSHFQIRYDINKSTSSGAFVSPTSPGGSSSDTPTYTRTHLLSTLQMWYDESSKCYLETSNTYSAWTISQFIEFEYHQAWMLRDILQPFLCTYFGYQCSFATILDWKCAIYVGLCFKSTLTSNFWPPATPLT